MVWRSSARTPPSFREGPGATSPKVANLGISYPSSNKQPTTPPGPNPTGIATLARRELIDALPTVRHIAFERRMATSPRRWSGSVASTMRWRQTPPAPAAPPRLDLPRGPHLLPVTYFDGVVNYGGGGAYATKGRPFALPAQFGRFALRGRGGRWTIRGAIVRRQRRRYTANEITTPKTFISNVVGGTGTHVV